MSHARDHGHAARKSQHNVSRIGNGLPGPHPIPLRPRERGYQQPISVTERANGGRRPCIGPLAGLPSFRARSLSLSLSTVLWEGGRADVLPFSLSLSFPSPIYLLAPHPNPQIDVTSHSLSLWTHQTCSSATKLFAHQTS